MFGSYVTPAHACNARTWQARGGEVTQKAKSCARPAVRRIAAAEVYTRRRGGTASALCRMRSLEALAYLAQPRGELRIERLRMVTLQQLAQIAVDACVQVGIRSARAAEWHVGSEVAALPQVLAAMNHRVRLRQVVAARADGACEIERECVVIDLYTLPHGAQQAGEVVAQEQCVQRIGQSLVERAEIVERGGTAEEGLQHAGGELGDGILIEAARTRVAPRACEGREAEGGPHPGP